MTTEENCSNNQLPGLLALAPPPFEYPPALAPYPKQWHNITLQSLHLILHFYNAEICRRLQLSSAKCSTVNMSYTWRLRMKIYRLVYHHIRLEDRLLLQDLKTNKTIINNINNNYSCIYAKYIVISWTEPLVYNYLLCLCQRMLQHLHYHNLHNLKWQNNVYT